MQKRLSWMILAQNLWWNCNKVINQDWTGAEGSLLNSFHMVASRLNFLMGCWIGSQFLIAPCGPLHRIVAIMMHHDSLLAKEEQREEGRGRGEGREARKDIGGWIRKREEEREATVVCFFIIQSYILFVRIESLDPAHRITHRHWTSQGRKLPTSVVNTIFL